MHIEKENIKRNQIAGFTLVELLVVISIIGLLSSIVVSNISVSKKKARDARRIVEVGKIAKAMEMYYLEHGSYTSDIANGWEQTGATYNITNFADGSNLSVPTDETSKLVDEKFLSRFPVDPVNSNNGVRSTLKDLSENTKKSGLGYFID